MLDHKLTVEEMKEGGKLPVPADIVPHPDYDIEGELVNDGDNSNANLLKLCGLQITDLNVNAYSVECFGQSDLPIFDMNRSASTVIAPPVNMNEYKGIHDTDY